MFNVIKVKLCYTLDNETKIENIKLNSRDNLENAFYKYKDIKSPQKIGKEIEFYLQRENVKILLNKKVEIKRLNLKEGDLILVFFKDIPNFIENTHHNLNSSTGNLNGEINSSTDIEKPLGKRKNCILIILISIAIIIVGVIIFIIIHVINKNKKNQKIIEEPKNTDNNSNNDDGDSEDKDNDNNDQ